MSDVNEARVLAAIRAFTDEAGRPPFPEELASALKASTRQVHSALTWAKRRGEVGYDAAGRLVLKS